MDKAPILTDEQIQDIAITEDDLAEFEQMATIGLEMDEHLEYETRLTWLCNTRLKEYTAQAQRDADHEYYTSDKCPDCGGYGRYRYFDGGGDADIRTCPTCQGTGKRR